MTIKGLLAAAAGAALMTATTATAAEAPRANPAAKLSVTRAAAPQATASRIGAEVSTGTLLSIGVLAALVVGVLVATGGDDSDSN